jgi:hypothetical protein
MGKDGILFFCECVECVDVRKMAQSAVATPPSLLPVEEDHHTDNFYGWMMYPTSWTLFFSDGFYFAAEVEIENMDYNEETDTYYYPCPW